MFRLKLFGGLSIDGPDGPLTGRAVQRRRLALLALLGIARNRGFTRDKLIAYLWPDADSERARPLLSDSVYRINQAIGEDAILAVGDELRLNSVRISCDAAEFDDAIERGDWRRGVELHTAPLLDGFFLTGADEFERWAEAERQRYRHERERALEALATAAEDSAEAVRWWRMLASENPYSSRVALQLMRALDQAGDRAAAVQHARIHTVLMRDDLGLDADPQVQQYAEELRAAPLVRIQQHSSDNTQQAVADDDVVLERASVAEPPVALRARPRRRSLRVLVPLIVIVLVAVIFRSISSRKQQATAAGRPAAIVVLPFSDQSPAGDQEYFADGMAEELMLRLSRVPGMKVVGRTSAFAFKGQHVDAREIARILKVNAILSGSVRQAGNRVRITAQLVDAQTGFELWSESYERELADVFVVQDEISDAIAARLDRRLGARPAAAKAKSRIEDPEAYNRYLKGRFEWHKRSEQGLRRAVEYFEQATAIAPDYARAFAGLGDAYAVLGFYDYLPPREAFGRARAAAQRALQLDPTLAEPHATLAYIALYHDWEWADAEREFLHSLDLDPAYSTGHQWYANFLCAMGRFDDAAREMRAAQDIDPLSLVASAALGWVLYFAGDSEKAVQQLDRTLELNADFELAHLWRGMALEDLGRLEEAKHDLLRATELSGGSAISRALLARVHALSGEVEQARTILRELERNHGARYVPPYEIAKVHAALGDRATALRWLRRAWNERSHSIAFLAVDPQLHGLRDAPEFKKLLQNARLPHAQ